MKMSTHAKLVRMEDSIRRAIDLFYEYVEQSEHLHHMFLDKSEEGHGKMKLRLPPMLVRRRALML